MYELCFRMALVLVACAGLSIWLGRPGWRRIAALVFVFLADIALLAPISWEQAGESMLALPQALFNTMAMFVFENIADGIAEQLGDAGLGIAPLYLGMIHLMYIVSFGILAVTAYGLLTSRLSAIVTKLRIFWFRLWNPTGRLYVFNGLDKRTTLFLDDLFFPEGKPKNLRYHGERARLCIVSGVSRESLDINSTQTERFRGYPVRFTDLDITSVSDDRTLRNLLLRSSLSLHFFFFGGEEGMNQTDEGENLSKGIVFLENLGNMIGSIDGKAGDRAYLYDKTGLPRVHAYIACRGRSDELFLDSLKGVEDIDVRVVDEGREIAHRLFWEHPLTEVLGGDGASAQLRRRLLEKAASCDAERGGKDAQGDLIPIHIVLLGMGHYGFEVFRAATWCGQIPGTRLKVHIVDERKPRTIQKLIEYYCPGMLCEKESENGCKPGVLFDIEYIRADVRTADFKTKMGELAKAIYEDINAHPELKGERTCPFVVISLGNEDLNVDTAILVRQLFYLYSRRAEEESPRNKPYVFVDMYDERRSKTLESLSAKTPGKQEQPYDFIPFGGIKQLFREAYLVDSDFEALAYNANASYEDDFDPDGQRKTARELFTGYSKFQMNRLSSLTNALSIPVKLWSIGYSMTKTSAGKGDNTGNLSSCFGDDATIDTLARNEHIRWRSLYYAEGWQGETPEDSNYFKRYFTDEKNGIPARHDNHLLQLHPYLCDYDDLQGVAEKVGKGNPTEYDIRFIRDIPAILNDGNGRTGKKFGVVKTVDVFSADA